MKKFNDKFMIHLSDTDATGVIFFPKLFEACVKTLEKFLFESGLQGVLFNHKVMFPVISTQAHFFSPIKLHDCLKVELCVSRIGKTSMTFHYAFINQSGLLAAEAVLAHVCVDSQTKVKKELPDEWVEIFSKISN